MSDTTGLVINRELWKGGTNAEWETWIRQHRWENEYAIERKHETLLARIGELNVCLNMISLLKQQHKYTYSMDGIGFGLPEMESLLQKRLDNLKAQVGQ